jgi:hypothetical protein
MNNILETTKFVIENSESVKIDRARIVDFAESFEHGTVHHWLSQAPFNFSHFSDNDKLHFLFVFNALSFCYWGEPKWTIDHEGKSYDGAWGMIIALGRAIKEGYNILDFQYCANLSANDFGHILRANVEIPLFTERLKIINEIGKIVQEKYDGQLANLIIEANKDSQTMLDLIVTNFPGFKDEAIYKEQHVLFNKRAQLLSSDIYQIFKGQGFGDLKNIDSITACADYKLPQILRKLGIFIYSNDLANKIDQKIELIHNSNEEIEIRANTIWAIEYIKQIVVKRSPKIMSSEINDHLWLATQEKFSDDKPYHRARTTAY